MAKAVPSKLTPNEFGALKFRHQPLTEASCVNAQFDEAKHEIPCYGF
jgi:hypothetical protein